MTTTELEHAERTDEERESKPPLMHCYCLYCAWEKAPNTISAMCGGGVGKTAGELDGHAHGFPPLDACVVCQELAPNPCQRCGM